MTEHSPETFGPESKRYLILWDNVLLRKPHAELRKALAADPNSAIAQKAEELAASSPDATVDQVAERLRTDLIEQLGRHAMIRHHNIQELQDKIDIEQAQLNLVETISAHFITEEESDG